MGLAASISQAVLQALDEYVLELLDVSPEYHKGVEIKIIRVTACNYLCLSPYLFL